MEDRPEQEIIYGRHPVLEALRAGRPLQRLFVLAGAQGISRELFGLARSKAIPVVHTDRARLDGLTKHANHQGVAAAVAARDFAELQEVLEQPMLKGQKALLLALDEVQDPGNFGALLRTAEGAGVHGVIVPGANACAFTATVTKASAGADQYLRVARVPKLGPVLRKLREVGYSLVGADAGGSCNYTQVDYCQPTVIILGAEGKGLRPSLKELCTSLVSIPLLGKVQSLNVSAAGAVILYEAVRQRLDKK